MDAVLVLLLLAVIWAVVLVPPWLQARREALPAASIRSFHRQLWSLGQAAPGYRAVPVGSHVRPVRREAVARRRLYDHEHEPYGDEPDVYLDPDLDLAYGDDGYALAYDDVWDDEAWDAEPEGEAVVVAASSASASALADGDEPDLGVAAGGDRWADRWAPVAASRPGRPHLQPQEAADAARRRAEGYRRRRQVLATLLVASAATAVPAVAVGGTAWIAASVATSLLVVAYLALLVRRQRRTLERAEKVRYLAPIVAPRPAVVVLNSGAAR